MSEPVERFAELPRETREFLAELSKEDATALKTGIPLIRMVIGFGKVSRWLIVTLAGLAFGFVMLWESLQKIVAWFKPPP